MMKKRLEIFISDDEKLIVISNFDAENTYEFNLKIPQDIITTWNLENGTSYTLNDQLYHKYNTKITVEADTGTAEISLQPLQSLILKLKK